MSPETERTLVRARQAIRQGKWEDALALVQQAALDDPNSAYVYHVLGICMDRLERYEPAKAALHRAVDLDHLDMRARLNLGLAYLHSGDLSKAREIIQAVAELRPDLPGVAEAVEYLRPPPPTPQPGYELDELPPLVPAEETKPSEVEAEWDPFLAESHADGGPQPEAPPQFQLALPPEPTPVTSSTAATIPDDVAPLFQRGLTLGNCVRIAWEGVWACPGDVGIVTLAFVGTLAGIFGFVWALQITLAVIGSVVGPLVGVLGILALAAAVLIAMILAAGMTLVGVMTADRRLYGLNPPSTEDLWAPFSEYGVLAAAIYGKVLLLVPLYYAVTKAASATGGAAAPIIVAIVLGAPLLWLGGRLWFVVHVILTTETELGEAFRESWELTRRAPWRAAMVYAATLPLALVGPAVGACALPTAENWPVSLALLIGGLVLTLFTFPLAAATAGAAYRLLYNEKHPGATPLG